MKEKLSSILLIGWVVASTLFVIAVMYFLGDDLDNSYFREEYAVLLVLTVLWLAVGATVTE